MMRTEAAASRAVRSAASPSRQAVVIVAVMLGVLPLARAGWDGNADIQLGESVAAAFVRTPGTEVHRFTFYAPATTILGATLKITSSTNSAAPLATALAVFRADDTPIPLGTTWSPRTKTIKGLVLAESDEYYLEVTSSAGTGGYSLKTTAKFPSTFKVILPAAGNTDFAAITGARLSATVARNKGSTAYPSFTSLTGRYGAVALPALPTVTPPKTPALTALKKVLLPWNSAYTLGVAYLPATTDAGAAVGTGAATVSGTIASPKARHTWYLGPIDPPSTTTLMAGLWRGSGHADARSEAFTHWDSANAVERGCARCHSSAGFQDFIGADGTADNRFGHPAQADGPAAIGVIDCNACHSLKAAELDAVVFPSDRLAVPAAGSTPAKPARPAVAMDLGPEARCMQCHQGRESTNSVDEYIATKAPASDDTVIPSLSFKNVHYLAAAATLYGGGARGAYQYLDGKTNAKRYDGLNPHVPGARTCVECHNPHSLAVEVALCARCHVTDTSPPASAWPSPVPVATLADLRTIRMVGSTADYDGDGNTTEGIYDELLHLSNTLYAAIQAYATNVAHSPIVYDEAVYPYFTTANGGSYTSWTPRLLRAAYNYNYYIKEPGTYAHNPKYMIEVLYDSIADLAAVAGVTVPQLADMQRSDPGHFDGQSPAYRAWDAVGATNSIDRGDVPAACAPCHSNGGFEFWQTYALNTTVAMPAADGMECGTCHVGGNFAAEDGPALKVVKTVLFPSLTSAPVTLTNSTTALGYPDSSFICMSCHRGRESMATVDKDIADRAALGQAPRARSAHYLPAGASLYGRDAKVAYMFGPPTSYSAKWAHNGGISWQCKYCHVQGKTVLETLARAPDPSHTFKARLSWNCLCHSEAGDDIEAVRLNRNNYDGFGTPSSGNPHTLKQEVASFETALLAALNTYAAARGFDALAYVNGSFVKAVGGATYTTWDATMVRAAFNYDYSRNEPGAWAHNTKFILQILYDSIDMLNDSPSPGTLNGNVPVLQRPDAAW
jgi:hypothetical protein